MIEQIGRYLVRGEIGKGGFGVVYRAWDPIMRRDVAIKVLSSVNDPGMRSRFLSEPATTGILKHKNIITVYDFGEHDAAPYLVMELLEGRSLREAIESGPRLSLSEKVVILGEIARGLLHAHQNGVIHRDVKPANIMLLGDGGVKILDFGIARVANPNLTRQTSTGMMVGTPEYMAPEQFAGEDATALSDIFAYGVVCYELISGEQPFRGPHLAAVSHLVTTKVPAPLRTVAPDCPEALESIVRMAMAKRCAERYQSLQELLFDLAPIEAGFRKSRVDRMAAEAEHSFEAGDLDSTQKLVWRALELEPNHAQSQELRRRIQRQRERPALEERWKGAVQEAEGLLQQSAFDPAIQALEAMRGWLSSDIAGDLRADLEARLAAARQAQEKAQRIAALLAEAQEAVERRDLARASRGVAQVLQLDSGNTLALALAGWISVETERARVDADKAGREQPHREEPSTVTQDFRENRRPSSSRRWILVAAGGALVLVVSAILWQQHSPVPQGGLSATSNPHPNLVPKKEAAVEPSTPPVVQPAKEPSPAPKNEKVADPGLGPRATKMDAKKRPTSVAPAKDIVAKPSLRTGETKVNPKDGLTYVWISPGTFQMGCSPGDSECSDDEKPAHQVTITKGFWMGQTEVTQEAYQQVMGTNPSNFRGAKLPVENITWNDAKTYCQAADMRLPTEAEWEYAARAGSSGSRYGDLDTIAWYNANSGGKTHEVGAKQANAWGLHDMLGNVWEWVADWYAPDAQGSASDPQGAASGTLKSERGGGWRNPPRYSRASYRNWPEPPNHGSNLGVRCGGN